MPAHVLSCPSGRVRADIPGEWGNPREQTKKMPSGQTKFCPAKEGEQTVRQNLKPKEKIKLANQSLVFEAFTEEEKLTISELTFRVNEKLEAHERLSEQTIRRAVTDLCASGHIRPYGKSNNAQTYGKLSAAMTSSASESLVPFGGQLNSVKDFVELMCLPESTPLQMKVPLLSDAVEHTIRRTMVHTVLTSTDAGNSDALQKSNRRLHNVVAELQFLLDNLNGFLNSPIWYPQYRDRIAHALRRIQQDDAELYQLAEDYVRSQ